jgi:hypothetical protein
MFRPSAYALTHVCTLGATVTYAGSLGACKGLAAACHLWPAPSDDPDALVYTGAHHKARAELYPALAGPGPWRIRLPRQMVEGLAAPAPPAPMPVTVRRYVRG